MESSQYKLVFKVLERLDKVGFLRHVLLIGSWCLPFYKEYFKDMSFQRVLRTRDIDFLAEVPVLRVPKVDIGELIRDLGFIPSFKGTQGYIKYEHPELILEFLVPARGGGSDKPYPLACWGVNAQPLPYLSFLIEGSISLALGGLQVRVPHPARFALHKLIVFQRRKNREKIDKDIDQALSLLKALSAQGEMKLVRKIYRGTIPAWRKTIAKGLTKTGNKEILEELEL